MVKICIYIESSTDLNLDLENSAGKNQRNTICLTVFYYKDLAQFFYAHFIAVSYTHLTLPTIYSV